MTRFLLALAAAVTAAVAASSGTVAAQPAAATPGYLSQRAVEELAADGIVLSRLGVVLQVELVGAGALVSLVDGNGRAVAATRIAALPADRDAAVATLTPVVANLVAQLAARPPAADASRQRIEQLERSQRELEVRAAADRAEVQRIYQAEAEYRALAIRFEIETVVNGSGLIATPFNSRRDWTALRGDNGEILEGASFYQAIERNDMLEAYERRVRRGRIAAAGGGILVVGSIGLAATTDESGPRRTAAIAGVVGGALVATIGILYLFHPHPVDEDGARQLGTEYNRKLRRRLRLPESVPGGGAQVRWSPYVGPGGGGVALSGRF